MGKKKKYMYKIGTPRYSTFHNCQVVDILERKTILGLIGYWSHHDTIKNVGQADEVVFLLNNPAEMKSRITDAIKSVVG